MNANGGYVTGGGPDVPVIILRDFALPRAMCTGHFPPYHLLSGINEMPAGFMGGPTGHPPFTSAQQRILDPLS